MDEFIIEARKKYSKLISLSRRQAKKGQCLWCGKEITRFCNSHSVPQFVLRNINVDGKLDNFNSIINVPLINNDQGINEAGTFKLLCNECDNKIFQEYENPNNLAEKPNERMLEEIALKNTLMMLNKRYLEKELFNNLQQQYQMPYPYAQKQEVNELDERDYFWHYNRICEMMKSGKNESRFNLFYWKKLDYKVPIAFQGMISLYGDLNGNIVTDIYNKSEKIINKHMHLCMFPLETESVVFAFYHEEDKEYDEFAKQFTKLHEDEKLALLSYIVYEYQEEMIFAKKFPHRTWLLNKVRETFLDTQEIYAFSRDGIEIEKNKQLKKLKYWDRNFPNVLSSKFSVKEER